MANRNDQDRDQDRPWRRFDEPQDFRSRPGGLDRRWGYGGQLTGEGQTGRGASRKPGGRPAGQGGGRGGKERSYSDRYNAPDYWTYQESWMRPGPFTGLGPRDYRRTDERIYEDICDRLAQHPQIDASNIAVEMKDGEVILRGTVDSRRTRRLVETNIEMIPGVVDVNNELRLTPEGQAEPEEKDPYTDPFPSGPTPTGNAGY